MRATILTFLGTRLFVNLQPLGRRVPFAFLEDIRHRFFDAHANEAGSAAAFALNDAFAPILAQRMVRG